MGETATVDRFLEFPEVRNRTTLSRTTLWRREREGAFPRAVRISKGRVGWRESEVQRWLEERSAERGAA